VPRDVVDDWKAVVAEQLRDEASARAGWPAVRFAFAPSFLLVAIAKTLAWAAIGKNDPVLAHMALMRVQYGHFDVHLLAAYLACCNRGDEALELLQRARESGHRTQQTTKLLVDLLFRRGDTNDALEIARSDEALLLPEDLQAVERHTRESQAAQGSA
jgi:hypothetical protein